MRAFVAIDTDGSVREHLRGFQQKLIKLPDKISVVSSENIHLTLQFLGEVSEEQIEVLIPALKEYLKDSKKFTMEVKGSGIFPSEKKPRVIWAGVDRGKEELTLLYETLFPLWDNLEIAIDDTPFKTHLTIGRVKLLRDTAALVRVVEEFKDITFGTQKVEKVYLKKSTLTGRGAVYENVAEIELR